MKSLDEIYLDFPVLQRQHCGRRIVYLDSGATAQRPQAVIDAVADHMQTAVGNPHRGSHILAVEASTAYEETRDIVQKFINAKRREEIIFVRNATEGMNLIANAYAMPKLKKGDKIVITIAEHHANLVPWQIVAQQTGAILEYLYLDEEGYIKPDEFSKIDKNTKIVSVAHVSNVLGVKHPIEKLIKLAHEVGAIAIIDGAQSVPHMKIDVQALDCDFYVFSGHKMCASQGIGVIYGKYDVLKEMNPFLYGGDMIEYVQEQKTSFNEIPYVFEAGTPNADGAVSLKAAIRYLNEVGMENIAKHEAELMEFVLPKMQAMPHINVLGPQNPKNHHGVIAFEVEGVHPHDVATILDSKGICVRSGHHCAQPLGAFYKLPSTTRLSAYLYTTKEELEYFLEQLAKVRTIMGYED